MISYLKWKVIKLDMTYLTILLSSWIGYDVWINEITYSNINFWEEIDLYIYHHITEGNQSLFWFLTEKEKEVFKELIKVSGVWWKVALSILSLWVNRLAVAINSKDKKTIEQIKWIWKKMAEKIILELKDKDFVKNYLVIDSWNTIKQKQNLENNLYNEIKITLVAMWYNPRNIENVLDNLPEDIDSTEKIIPYAIKNLS